MKYVHEGIQFKDNMPINVEIKTLTNSPGHWHNDIEIYLVLSGVLSITVENESYHLIEDDIILVNSGQIHEIEGNNNVVVILQINQSFYRKSLEGASFICNSSAYYNKAKFHALKRIIAKIIQINYNDREDHELLIVSLSYQLMLELVKNFKNNEEKSGATSSKSLQRLGSIIQYMNEHYAEDITLEQIAEREYLSPAYLSHYFKLNMNITIFNYLTVIRMNHAVNDLLTTSMTIEQIAANNGFANSRYFVNTFKKQFGMLPRQYRAKQKSNLDMMKPNSESTSEGEGGNGSGKGNHTHDNYSLLRQYDFLNRLGEYLDSDNHGEEFGNNPKIHTRIEVNVTEFTKTLLHTFRTFTGVGRARELLLESVQHQLRTLQREVGFRYIKFHGILDDSMMLYNEDSQGFPYLTYYYVDQVIDFLLSVGLKPLIELSFMPRLLAKDPGKTFFHNPVILSEPKDYDKWAYLITNLTNHFIERYGLSEVRTWMFSFWNVPFKTYIFSFDTNEIGYELYRLTRACVKGCDDKLSFGFPSYGSFGFETSEYYDFLDYCMENQCFGDFYILHCYPIKNASSPEFRGFGYHANHNAIILSEDPDFMTNLLNLVKKNLAPYPKLPLYITEWASTSSHRDWLNDTCYRSAYIVKSILENYDQVDSFGNWCLSDTLEELPLDDNLFHGELGLFTNSGIKKPAYYAYTFLKKLMNTLIASGNGYFITTNQRGDYVLLLYNYIHISPLYAHGVLFNVTFLERYNAFVNPNELDVDILLNHTENGKYMMTEHTVNRQYGSAFDEWVRMGALPLMTEEEINTLKGRSMPKITKANIEVSNNSINYYTKLDPHEIRLIEIRKK